MVEPLADTERADEVMATAITLALAGPDSYDRFRSYPDPRGQPRKIVATLVREKAERNFVASCCRRWLLLSAEWSQAAGYIAFNSTGHLLADSAAARACTSKPVPLSRGCHEIRVWIADGGDSEADHTLSLSYMPLCGSAPRPITPRSLIYKAEKGVK